MLKRDELKDPKSCLNKAADDEPIFVIRANDPLARKVVQHWAALALERGLHEDKIDAAFRFANTMEAWREQHHATDRGPVAAGGILEPVVKP